MMTIPAHTQPLATQKGMSLVELMISMTLGLVIIVAITDIFIRSNESRVLNHQLGLMQESARIAMSSIKADVRMAGFTGCNHKVDLGNALTENLGIYVWGTSEHPVQGMTSAATKTTINTDATSESLLIFKLDPSRFFHITGHNTSTQTIVLNRNPASILTEGMPVGLVRQDCTQVALVALSAVSSSGISHQTGSTTGQYRNCVSTLKGSFRCYDSSTPTSAVAFRPGYLSPVDSVTYFVTQTNGLPTLTRQQIHTLTPQPVVDGVEDIRVYYGLDTDSDGSPNRYIRAGDRSFRHSDWHQVSSIRVHILTRSEAEVRPPPAPPPAPQASYFFDGSNVVQTDRFLRREYVFTMAIRNNES